MRGADVPLITWTATAPSTGVRMPEGSRAYAIGDIHGRLDLLRELHAWIGDDVARRPVARAVLIHVGDYVDRGPDSRAVIDLLLDEPVPGTTAIHLCGNHERMMLDFHDKLHVGLPWLTNGGLATLASYGIATQGRLGWPDLRGLQAALQRELPARHLAFLQGLKMAWNEGGYLFVHAGIRPGVALDRQRDEDLIWIREEFLESQRDHGKVVVHGHTIRSEPELRANRIGIDTGAFDSGRLTCLVLDGAERHFAQTAP